MRILVCASAVVALTILGACDAPRVTQPAAGLRADRVNGGSFAFSPDAHPYGHDMVHWSQRYWKWAEGVPANQNPLVDTVGQSCVNGQRGDVWNLPFLVAPSSSGARACTIPHGKALVVILSGVWNDFPCPDTSFHPAPGQSLYQFLIQGAAPIVNGARDLLLVVDGDTLPNPTAYRFTSRALTYFTGDTSLETVVDPCITGHRQPAISDGYFVMLKPPAPGRHVITTSATDHGTVTVTYTLTVRRDDEGDRAREPDDE